MRELSIMLSHDDMCETKIIDILIIKGVDKIMLVVTLEKKKYIFD